ncbi:MAG: hypothetical protein ACRDLK_05250, partial [Gaiellaceae bacterium]
MDGFAQRRDGRLRPARILRLAGVVLAALLVVAAAVAAAVFLWVRTYTPLDAHTGEFAPGPGVGAVLEPAVGSGGKEVFFPVYKKGRDFVASLTLRNAGHFSVTVEELLPAGPESPPWIGPVTLLAADSASTSAALHARPFQAVTLAAGDSVVVAVRFEPLCPAGHRNVPAVFSDSIRLRYRYLHWFTREQTV